MRIFVLGASFAIRLAGMGRISVFIWIGRSAVPDCYADAPGMVEAEAARRITTTFQIPKLDGGGPLITGFGDAAGADARRVDEGHCVGCNPLLRWFARWRQMSRSKIPRESKCTEQRIPCEE